MTFTMRAFLLLSALSGGIPPIVGAQSRVAGLYRVIPTGRVHPIFSAGVPDSGVAVASFLLAARPVTNAEFLQFVIKNPEWRRSRIPRAASDSSYLRHWSSDVQLGPNALPTAPVVNVSWFAASAYAGWLGGRLPTTVEWELAASRFHRTVGDDPARLNAQVLAWYGAAAPPTLPAAGGGVTSDDGVTDLHGVVWEWVDDFNSVVTSGESRGDSGPDAGLFCAGGAALSVNPSNYSAFMRYALRGSLRGAYALATLGFRVARDIPPATTRRAR